MNQQNQDLELPHSPAAERNKAAILEKLQACLTGNERVLEIGSGTGQHAIHFAQAMPELTWQTSEMPSRLMVTSAVLNTVKISNLQKPYALDVTDKEWPSIIVDVIYTANTVHIMSWETVEKMLTGVAKVLNTNGLFIVYGPFKYQGDFTSESNQMFDTSLKERDAQQGIRDFEAVDKLANSLGLKIEKDFSMPANNQLLVYRKI